MPFTDVEEARDAIYNYVEDEWTANAGGAVMLYENVRADEPDGDESWAKTTVSHADGFRPTISGGVGFRRFRSTGVVTVEVRTPWGDGLAASDPLVKIVQERLELDGLAGVEFTNVRINEVGLDENGPWYQVNVIADFEYDRIR